MWSVTLRLLWFLTIFYGFPVVFTTFFSLMPSVTSLFHPKEHTSITNLVLLFVDKINNKTRLVTHDVVSYVTSFVVFTTF